MNKSRILFSCALGVGLALTSCQDEDFGVSQQEVAQVAYNRNFESVFGKVAPDQDFDFYAQVMKQLQGGAQTRAGETEVTVSELKPYAIDQAVITAATTEFKNDVEYKGSATQAGTLIVQDTKFTVSSINFGGQFETSDNGKTGSSRKYLSYGFEFGVVVGGQMYKIWGPSSEANGNTAPGEANPRWSKEVTVPYGSSIRFYLSYYGDWNAEHVHGGLVTAAQCPDCSGKGFTSESKGKCTVCGGDGKVDGPCTATHCGSAVVNGTTEYYSTTGTTYSNRKRCSSHSGLSASNPCPICGSTSDNNRPYYCKCQTCGGDNDAPNAATCTAEGCYGGKLEEHTTCETCHGCGINPNTTLPKHIIYSDSPLCVIAESASIAGAQKDKLFQVIAFEDDEKATGKARDFDDFMVAITAETLPMVITNAKRFMCEDMSQTDRETSWDFNDIVFDIQSESTSLNGHTTYSTKLYLQAVGGTWPIKLFISDGTTTHQVGDGELHKVLADADYDTPINVGAKNGTSTAGPKVFPYTDIEVSPNDLLDKVNSYIYALVYTGADKSQWENDNENWTEIKFQAPGEPARIVACPVTPWMKEDQKITKSYDFPNNNWWTSLVIGGAQYLY